MKPLGECFLSDASLTQKLTEDEDEAVEADDDIAEPEIVFEQPEIAFSSQDLRPPRRPDSSVKFNRRGS